jgi:uncharacterized protein HemY
MTTETIPFIFIIIFLVILVMIIFRLFLFINNSLNLSKFVSLLNQNKKKRRKDA